MLFPGMEVRERVIDDIMLQISHSTWRSNEQTYRDLLESFADGVTILTPDGLILDINQRPLEDAQLPREKVLGTPYANLPAWSHDPEAQQRLRTAIAQASTGETVRFEARIYPRPGMFLDILMTITSHRDANQQVEYLICAGRDITERKCAEEELRALIDAIPQLIWIMNPAGKSEYGNQRWRDYTAMAPQEYAGDGWLQALHPDDRQRTLEIWYHSLAAEEPFEAEYRIKDGHAGTYRWFLARALPVRDETTGQISKWFGTCTDIDEQKRMEEALLQSQERINLLMNSRIMGIFVSSGGQVVDANETYLHMVGYTREDLLAGRINWRHMTPPEYWERTAEARRELIAQRTLTPYEKEYICKDGSRLPVVVGGVALSLDPLQAMGFVLDNSARKELEQRKDDFISMASHELRNPLAAVKIQTQLVRKRLEKQSQHEAATALSRLEGPVKQLERLIGELLDVSRIQAGNLEYVQETVDLNVLLREITGTMQHLYPDHTFLVRGNVHTGVSGDRDRLGQVFTNLLSNAVKYAPGAKSIEIDLSSSEDVVTIQVTDHGLGIPQELRDKIFERFYRAADPKKRRIPGLGMGLYIVAEIIKHHGGTITVESTVGKGSTFTVTLPTRRDA